jgi:large subunit ribosomal protein L15
VKLHDLRPAPGSVQERTRVGRGIAAGKGKTAGRGTKGQKARAGGSIPAGFEGGQTPIHRRVPKLRGFKRRFKIEYEVVNVGRIAEAAELGRFAEVEALLREAGSPVAPANAPLTVHAELLYAAGLIGSARRPVKVLGGGEVSRPLFVIADAFTRSARSKIEEAGGTAQVLELPAEELHALGLEPEPAGTGDEPASAPDPSATDASGAATPEGEGQGKRSARPRRKATPAPGDAPSE